MRCSSGIVGKSERCLSLQKTTIAPVVPLALCLVLPGFFLACNQASPKLQAIPETLPELQASPEPRPVEVEPPPRSAELRLGTRFATPSSRFRQAPTLTSITLPTVRLANAIWGATGRDDHGNLYLGISSGGPGRKLGALCRIAPGAQTAVYLGDAVASLDAMTAEPDSQQAKIHGKPVQADDGLLYFASMDEEGEKEDGSALPVWGSHLWRLDPTANNPTWEHLHAVPEALIATGCSGRYVYALGYFQHVIYQFDTKTGSLRRKAVGSTGGHVSRNFLVDVHEHIYVPRVDQSSKDEFTVTLVELNTQLEEVTSHPLPDYGATARSNSHGIVGFAALRTGEFIFTTAKGALYHLQPQDGAASELERLGWIHPQGQSYTAFMACPDGQSVIGAIARPAGKKEYQWVVYDVASKATTILPLEPQSAALLKRPKHWLMEVTPWTIREMRLSSAGSRSPMETHRMRCA